MKTVTAVLTLLAITSAVSPNDYSAAQDPPGRTRTIIGPAPRVDTLRELWDKTPAVVLATALRSLPPQVERGRIVTRVQILEVDEVFKDSAGGLRPGAQIRVKFYGGTVTTGDREVITDIDIEPLPRGDQAILFVSALPEGNAFQVPYGNVGFFKVTDNSTLVAISPAARHFQEFGGRPQLSKPELAGMFAAFKGAK